MLKIGTTERGDAALDFSWVDKIQSGEVDAAVIMTKDINDLFIDQILQVKDKVILHATITGWGGTKMEPDVPKYEHNILQLAKLIQRYGFPPNQVVVRIDPIFPSEKGLIRAEYVVRKVRELCPQVKRFRVSLLKTYNHVRKRFVDADINVPWDSKLVPGENLELFATWLNKIMRRDERWEACNEIRLLCLCSNLIHTGCVSECDLKLLRIKYSHDDIETYMNHRKGCCCINAKTELFEKREKCSYGCVYCHWHDNARNAAQCILNANAPRRRPTPIEMAIAQYEAEQQAIKDEADSFIFATESKYNSAPDEPYEFDESMARDDPDKENIIYLLDWIADDGSWEFQMHLNDFGKTRSHIDRDKNPMIFDRSNKDVTYDTPDEQHKSTFVIEHAVPEHWAFMDEYYKNHPKENPRFVPPTIDDLSDFEEII